MTLDPPGIQLNSLGAVTQRRTVLRESNVAQGSVCEVGRHSGQVRDCEGVLVDGGLVVVFRKELVAWLSLCTLQLVVVGGSHDCSWLKLMHN